jgi:hypothetical protein
MAKKYHFFLYYRRQSDRLRRDRRRRRQLRVRRRQRQGKKNGGSEIFASGTSGSSRRHAVTPVAANVAVTVSCSDIAESCVTDCVSSFKMFHYRSYSGKQQLFRS